MALWGGREAGTQGGGGMGDYYEEGRQLWPEAAGAVVENDLSDVLDGMCGLLGSGRKIFDSPSYYDGLCGVFIISLVWLDTCQIQFVLHIVLVGRREVLLAEAT